MTTYRQKYRDPRWQKRRLEIMKRADFACEACGDKTTTLNVHHKIYRKGADPWDYPDHQLQCLCENCHIEEHAVRAEIESCFAEMDLSEMLELPGYAQFLVAMRLAHDQEQMERRFTFSYPETSLAFVRLMPGIEGRHMVAIANKLASDDASISVEDVYELLEAAEERACAGYGGGNENPAR